MIDLIKYALDGGFFRWIGFVVILLIICYFVFNFILQIIHKIIRAGTIAKQGYPPPHCDGDGDFEKHDSEI